MGNNTFKVTCFSPWGNRKSFSRAEESTISNNPPETVTRNRSPTSLITKPRMGLAVSTRGEIRYHKKMLKAMSNRRLRIDKKRNAHLLIVLDCLFGTIMIFNT
jgi:hypothetical protein